MPKTWCVSTMAALYADRLGCLLAWFDVCCVGAGRASSTCCRRSQMLLR